MNIPHQSSKLKAQTCYTDMLFAPVTTTMTLIRISPGYSEDVLALPKTDFL